MQDVVMQEAVAKTVDNVEALRLGTKVPKRAEFCDAIVHIRTWLAHIFERVLDQWHLGRNLCPDI